MQSNAFLQHISTSLPKLLRFRCQYRGRKRRPPQRDFRTMDRGWCPLFEGRAPSRADHLHEFRKAMGIGIFIDSSTAFYSKFQKRDSPLVVQELQ
jgi:hypothetical protein